MPAKNPRHERLRAAWPTPSELRDLLQNHGNLKAVAKVLGRPYPTVRNIARRQGVTYQPRVTNLSRSSHVRLGWEGEEHAAKILGGTLARTQALQGDPYDVDWNGLRIEVKTARPSAVAGRPSAAPTWGWSFKTGHNKGKNDAYFCIGCSPDGVPLHYFLVPTEVAPAELLRIPLSLRSKWAPYEWRP